MKACFAVICFFAACASATHVGADPSGGWLSYAIYNAPNPTDGEWPLCFSNTFMVFVWFVVITKLSATMVVPDTPQSRGGSPAFWFGVQTQHGDGALIQPIMAKWLGKGFIMAKYLLITNLCREWFLHVPGDIRLD
jgi:hypothetical protein